MLHGNVPVLSGDAEAFVRGLQVAADVKARPACRRAQLIDYQLADPHLRIVAGPHKESADGLVGCQPADELIGHEGKRIVSAKSLVERVFALSRNTPSGSNARY